LKVEVPLCLEDLYNYLCFPHWWTEAQEIDICIVVRIGERTKIEIRKFTPFRPITSPIKLHTHLQVKKLDDRVLKTISSKPLGCNFEQGRGALLFYESGKCLDNPYFCVGCPKDLLFNIFIKI